MTQAITVRKRAGVLTFAFAVAVSAVPAAQDERAPTTSPPPALG